MKRSELKNYIAWQCPGVKLSTAPAGVVDNAIQLCANEVAARTLCLPKNIKFSAVAGSTGAGEYTLSTIDSEFIQIAPSGLYWNQGTVASPDWKQLDAVTIKWLDENRRNWRSESAGTPQQFYQDGDTLGVYPDTESALSDGLWLYYGLKAFTMTTDDDYPFYGASEIARLSILDEAITKRFKMLSLGAADKRDDYNLEEKAFEREIVKVKGILGTNRAVLNSRYNRFQGRKVRNT